MQGKLCFSTCKAELGNEEEIYNPLNRASYSVKISPMIQKSEKIILLEEIELAFGWRTLPKNEQYISSKELTPDEIMEVENIKGKYWNELTGDLLEASFSVVSWLSPYAFCYYLPGFLSVGIKENMPHLIVNHSIFGMLDRTPNPEWWDDFFIVRWPLLTFNECNVAQNWIFWLSSFSKKMAISDDSLINALVTLELLKSRCDEK